MDTDLLIIGCGWLGKQVAEQFVNGGKNVLGLVKTNDHQSQSPNFKVLKVNLADCSAIELLSKINAKNVLVAIPPSIIENRERYPEIIINAVRMLPQTFNKLIYVSSISVYPSIEIECNESVMINANNTGHPILHETEQKLLNAFSRNLIILRMAGLIGEGRHPGNFFKQSKIIPNGNTKVNLVLGSDCANIIYEIIEQNMSCGIYNVCSSQHPSKIDYYSTMARKINNAIPLFETQAHLGKIANGNQIISILSLSYSDIYMI